MVAVTAVLGWVCAADSGCGSSSENGQTDAEVQRDAAVRPDADISQFDFPVKVSRIIDGDTITVVLNGGTMDVRFIGVDTPELFTDPAEPFAQEAKDFTAYFAPVGEWVGLEFDDPSCASQTPPASCYDLYDRLLAYIRVYGGGDLGAMLLSSGLARVYTGSDYSRRAEYTQLEAEARSEGLGIWQ